MNYVICTTIVALGLILTGYATAADEINRQDVVGLMPSDYISVGNLYTDVYKRQLYYHGQR